MEQAFSIGLLIIAVIFSEICYGYFNKIPLAFYQIAMGLLLALLPAYHHYQLNPDIFMFAIIAPLLFNEGQTTSRSRLKHGLLSTLSLAVGLVLISVLVTGFSIHAIYPALALPLAFMISSIVTPTDATAVSSVTKKLPVPEQAMSLLKNESLFNDASGIVAFNVSLSAFLSGNFSPANGAGEFLLNFFGGLASGLIMGYLIVFLRMIVYQKVMDNPTLNVSIQWVTPFAVYFVAETFHVSGILAVVAAGIVHGMERDQLRLISTRIQVVETSLWTILTNLLNGFVFVLMGVTLPTVIGDLQIRHLETVSRMILFALIIYVLMTLIRFIWARFFVQLPLLNLSKSKTAALIAVCGVHGTITLSIAFSIPLTTHAGTAFPMRNDLIFIATVVILLSLIVPLATIGMLLPETNDKSDIDLVSLRNRMLDYSINHLRESAEPSTERQLVVETLYQLKAIRVDIDQEKVEQLFQDARRVEEEAIKQAEKDGLVTKKEQILYEHFLMLGRGRPRQNLLYSMWLHFKMRFLFFIQRVRIKRIHQHTSQFENKKKARHVIERRKRIMHRLEQIGYQAVSDFLREQDTAQKDDEVNIVLRHYDERHRRINASEKKKELQSNLFIQAFQTQYEYIQKKLADKKISPRDAKKLGEQISYDEMVYMQNDDF
ncbi:sodium:proton antiporter [Sporolactobacillus sp. THM7-4]|nr:sodium:proton antiporter [Sporolactobacillus sp. THM7-4]